MPILPPNSQEGEAEATPACCSELLPKERKAEEAFEMLCVTPLVSLGGAEVFSGWEVMEMVISEWWWVGVNPFSQ